MEKSKKSINVEGGFLFCGGWNFSKSVSMGPTFIRQMRVMIISKFRHDKSHLELQKFRHINYKHTYCTDEVFFKTRCQN